MVNTPVMMKAYCQPNRPSQVQATSHPSPQLPHLPSDAHHSEVMAKSTPDQVFPMPLDMFIKAVCDNALCDRQHPRQGKAIDCPQDDHRRQVLDVEGHDCSRQALRECEQGQDRRAVNVAPRTQHTPNWSAKRLDLLLSKGENMISDILLQP